MREPLPSRIGGSSRNAFQPSAILAPSDSSRKYPQAGLTSPQVFELLHSNSAAGIHLSLYTPRWMRHTSHSNVERQVPRDRGSRGGGDAPLAPAVGFSRALETMIEFSPGILKSRTWCRRVEFSHLREGGVSAPPQRRRPLTPRPSPSGRGGTRRGGWVRASTTGLKPRPPFLPCRIVGLREDSRHASGCRRLGGRFRTLGAAANRRENAAS